MSDSAFQIQYRQQFVQQFEQHVSVLKETVITEAVIKGNQAVFLVAGSGSATAVTRGINGMIPARSDSLTQTTATLQEWHDLVRRDGFNIFGSQGNATAIMQMSSVGTLNRLIDSLIINQLNTGTVTIGAAGTIPNLSLVQNAMVKLGNASVPNDSNITALIQPAFLAYLEQTTEFANMQYVDVKPYAGSENASWRDKVPAYRWRNMLIMSHPGLPGRGTTSEKNFIYHKNAAGFAADTGGLKSLVGYEQQQDYSWARTTIYAGAALLQNTGVVIATTDGSAYA